MFKTIGMAAAAVSAPVTISNDVSIAQSAKYPIQDFDNGIQGRTKIRISVNPKGRQYRCEIIRSSGSKSLDAQSCEEFMTKGKFKAARDLDGSPITGQVNFNMNWRIPGSSQLPPMTLLPDVGFTVSKLPDNIPYAWLNVSVLVDERGVALHCDVSKSSEIEMIDRIACPTVLGRTAFAAAVDQSDQSVRSIQTLFVVFAPSNPAMFDASISVSNGIRPAVILSYEISKRDIPSRKTVGAEGIATMQILVSPTAAAETCRVIRSSGSALLDSRSCEIATKYIKYQAAQSLSGANIEQSLDLTIEWQFHSPCRTTAPNALCIKLNP